MAELHLPVMAAEVRQYLLTRRDGVYVDATVGDGGHAAVIASSLDENGLLIGIDWDSSALQRAEQRLAEFSTRVKLIQPIHRWKDLKRSDCPLLTAFCSTSVSLQFTEPVRGFTLPMSRWIAHGYPPAIYGGRW